MNLNLYICGMVIVLVGFRFLWTYGDARIKRDVMLQEGSYLEKPAMFHHWCDAMLWRAVLFAFFMATGLITCALSMVGQLHA